MMDAPLIEMELVDPALMEARERSAVAACTSTPLAMFIDPSTGLWEPLEMDCEADLVFAAFARAFAAHFGAPYDVAFKHLTDLDTTNFNNTGAMFFERHLIDPVCWPEVARALLHYLSTTLGLSYSSDEPFAVTLH